MAEIITEFFLQQEKERRRALFEYQLHSDQEIEDEIIAEIKAGKENVYSQSSSINTSNLGILINFYPEFGKQVDTLIKRGYTKALGITVNSFRDKLIAVAAKVSDGKKFKDPLIVITDESLPLRKKIKLMEYRGKGGSATSSLVWFRDIVIIPGGFAYFLIDVSFNINGGRLPSQVEMEFKEKGRSPLTLTEGIALVTLYPDIFGISGLDLIGSQFKDEYEEFISAIWVMDKKEPPWVAVRNKNISNSKFVPVSCAARIGF